MLKGVRKINHFLFSSSLLDFRSKIGPDPPFSSLLFYAETNSRYQSRQTAQGKLMLLPGPAKLKLTKETGLAGVNIMYYSKKEPPLQSMVYLYINYMTQVEYV